MLPIINGFPNKQAITLNSLARFKMDKSNSICGNGIRLSVEKVGHSEPVFVFGEVLVVVMVITFDGADDPLQMLALIAVGSAARADLQGIIRAVFGEVLD